MTEPQQSASTAPPTQPIILDTNVLQYFGNKDMVVEILQYFFELSKRNFILKISDISFFELLCGSTATQEIDLIKTLNLFPIYQITNNALLLASRLSTLYGKERQQISVPDKIIAASAIVTNSLIMTADFDDFPRPFFIGVETRSIYYLKDSRQCLTDIMLLIPNYQYIQLRFSNRPK